ncbi:MAG: DUF2281 domain-containing protein [Thermodesulfovibrionales bacterium]|nr:DUF2281 domain-containing protein [Nitrospinota bacterium]MCG2708736.1 DUF2281 domain-containing protein [Thermodesulfovibrionales bacterium]
MSLSEKILKHIQELPEPFQAEVLDFVEYLESKTKKGKKIEGEETDWSELSLSFAMRGMEDEYSPYSLNDLKERFT